jgi:hypothetical protein
VSPAVVTATSVQAVVPGGAITGPISVANANGTATTPTAFKVLPKITGFTPPTAELESTVVVSGTNLKVGSTDPVVKVGAIAAAVVASSPTEVSFTVPLLAVSATVNITTADGTATSVATLTVTP